jgi:anti-sigma B factor antagonist
MSSPVEVPTLSAQPSLAVSHRDGGDGICVVTPAGEIDLASAPRLKSSLVELLDAGYARFVLDLSEVRYLDSTGLGVLIAFSRRLTDDGQIVLAHTPHPVLGLLELTGLDARFQTFPNVEDALAQVRGDHQLAQSPLCPDAAIVLGLAATALPFAESSVDELRRWVRILSVHGEAGRALQRVGLTSTEAAIELSVTPGGEHAEGPQAHADSVTRVRAAAASIAADREATTVSTVDLLLAVMVVYGDAFDHELRLHGTNSIELIECLGTSPDRAGIS